jgi:hypothetical protein
MVAAPQPGISSSRPNEVAQRLGSDRVDYETPFGPSQVTMQTVDASVVTEDYPSALDAASRMPVNPGLPLAARCRHLTDRACAHANLDQEEQALALLLTAEGMSRTGSAIRHPGPRGDPRPAHCGAETVHAAAPAGQAHRSQPLGQGVLAVLR